jgi:trehalose 6-phosphate phosphatase
MAAEPTVWPPLPDPGAWALFLDIDGTLVDIAPTPGEAAVPPSLPPLLDQLSARLSGALALVSGRAIASLDMLLPGGRDAAGAHGAEWRLAGRFRLCGGPWPGELAAVAADEASRLPGVLVERKARSMSLHFRAAPAMADTVLDLAERFVRASPERLRLIHGKAVVEVVPAAAGKGPAIGRFMEVPPYAGRIPVFVGDDITDEEGFVAVNRMGGITVHVGDAGWTAATARLPSPAAVRRWLADVNTALGGSPQS